MRVNEMLELEDFLDHLENRPMSQHETEAGSTFAAEMAKPDCPCAVCCFNREIAAGRVQFLGTIVLGPVGVEVEKKAASAPEPHPSAWQRFKAWMKRYVV